MRKIIITLILTAGFSSLSLNAQKTLRKPAKKPQKPQTVTTPRKPVRQQQTGTRPNNPAKPQKTQAQSSISLTPSGTINGYEYVDLGLSVKWATCNMGASSPSNYGSYFAWGATTTKSEYIEANSVTYKKYMSDILGDSRYDAARANWGRSWRLPTKAEIEELINQCERKWTTLGGHNGYLVTGPNGKSIFLPAAGWRNGSSLYGVGQYGYYWSSTPYERDTQHAYYLSFYSGYFGSYQNYRYIGFTIRPVSK